MDIELLSPERNCHKRKGCQMVGIGIAGKALGELSLKLFAV